MTIVDTKFVKKFENTSGSMNVLGNKEKEGLEDKTTSTDVNKDISVTGSSSSAGSINTAPSPKQQQKPASSGTFTNLQQYAQANQGGAQKIAQSVTQNISQQGKQVQQQAGQQAARTQFDIAENTKKIEAEQKFASKQLERAGSTLTDETERQAYEQSKLKDKLEEFNTKRQELLAKQLEQNEQQKQLENLQKEYSLDYVYNPSEEEFKRFRDIVTGQTQFNQVRDLDLSNQMIASQQLQQQAQQAGTDTGRMALLRQMLGQGREYTRGQTALDTALLAKDAQARQALQQGVQQTAEQTQRGLQDITGEVSAKRQALQALNAQFGSDIMTEGESATTSVLDDVESGKTSLENARKQLATELGITEADAENRMREMAQERLSAAGVTSIDRNLPHMLELFGIGSASDQYKRKELKDQEALDLISDNLGVEMNLARGRELSPPNLKQMKEDLVNKFYQKDYQYDGALRRGWFGHDESLAGRILRAESDGINYLLNKQPPGSVGANSLAKQLAMSAGDPELYGKLFPGDEVGDANALYANLKAGKDINKQTAASIEQARRYNALQNLLKGQDIGDRVLNLEQAGKAAEQEALLRQARAEAMRKFKIEGE